MFSILLRTLIFNKISHCFIIKLFNQNVRRNYRYCIENYYDPSVVLNSNWFNRKFKFVIRNYIANYRNNPTEKLI